MAPVLQWQEDPPRHALEDFKEWDVDTFAKALVLRSLRAVSEVWTAGVGAGKGCQFGVFLMSWVVAN